MSSTRRAKDDSIYHQGRHASAPEFERGLLANLVAKRCALLTDRAHVELIWFLQHLSHQQGVPAVVKTLLEKYPERVATRKMMAAGLSPGTVCNADLVRELREDFGESRFLLKGEFGRIFGVVLAENLRADEDFNGNQNRLAEEIRNANRLPVSYPAAVFFDACRDVATRLLEKHLCDLCLDPGAPVCGPWYFPDLIPAIAQMRDDTIREQSAGQVVTALGAKVCEVLDYTAYSRGLTLMQGNARLGKSHAARAWCRQRPGQARYVEVPTGNDEASFFRALARGLGLGSFLSYKVTDIRERVESVLLTGDLLLVLDEAHRLWPQTNMRYGYPSRINWLMAMANHAIPICCIATPQFIELQKVAAEKGKWNSAQLTGRISHFETLPASLSESDLQAVAKSVLPEADATTLRALAVYAGQSDRYLAAIDSIAKRARFLADRAGRRAATTQDVRKAMQESVIPSDAKLQTALAAGRPGRLRPPACVDQAALAGQVEEAPMVAVARRQSFQEEIPGFPPRREMRPAVESPLIGAEK